MINSFIFIKKYFICISKYLIFYVCFFEILFRNLQYLILKYKFIEIILLDKSINMKNTIRGIITNVISLGILYTLSTTL